MSKNKNKSVLSPEDKLMKAIYGDKWKTEAEREAEIEEAVARVTPEKYKEMWGETVEETVAKVMDSIHEIEATADDLADAEEAADEYTRDVLERTNCLIGNQPVGEEIDKAFKAGASWMLKRIMKNKFRKS